MTASINDPGTRCGTCHRTAEALEALDLWLLDTSDGDLICEGCL